jgi:hypothetical protein
LEHLSGHNQNKKIILVKVCFYKQALPKTFNLDRLKACSFWREEKCSIIQASRLWYQPLSGGDKG